MSKKRLLLLGAGGHCKSVLDSLLSAGDHDELGVVDRAGSPCAPVLGVPVVGTDAELPALLAAGWDSAFVTLGSVGPPNRRRALYERLLALGFSVPSIADPTAVVSPRAVLAPGVFIGKRAVVNAGARLGVCVIINSGAVVEHDCEVGGFVHVSPGAILCGSVTVGENSHIGAGSVLRQGLRVGPDALVGAGSVAVADIPGGCMAFGNPCKVVKKL